MSDTSDPTPTQAKAKAASDEIPVEELVRLAREMTQRITNMDRQRLAQQLKENRLQIKTNAPITLVQFFTGEIDLDTELARRFAQAPLMSQIKLHPKRPAKLLEVRRASAVLTTQDEAAQMNFDLDIKTGAVEVTFTLGSMISQRFDIGLLEQNERHRWLDLIRRDSGIAFFWTSQRWEKDYLIFVVRENFARVYAFSPRKIEAAARITPDVLTQLINWIEAFWYPDHEVTIQSPQPSYELYLPGASVSADWLPGSLKDTSEINLKQLGLAKSEQKTPEPVDEPQEGDVDPSELDW